MPEYQQTRWQCDYCSRDVKAESSKPSGWQRVRVDFYGNYVIVCPCVECQMKLDLLRQNNEYARGER